METKKSFSNIALMFSVLYAIIGIIFMIIKPVTADPKDPTIMALGFLSLFIFIGIPIYAVKYYREQGYPVSIGSSIKLGVVIGLIGGLLLGIYSYIYFAYINPGAVDQVLEISRKMMEENNMFDEQMIEQQMETTKKMFLPMQIIAQVFAGLLYGVIGGLLGGLFFKTPVEDEY